MPRIVYGIEERQDSDDSTMSEERRKEILDNLAGQLGKICFSNRPSRESGDESSPQPSPLHRKSDCGHTPSPVHHPCGGPSNRVSSPCPMCADEEAKCRKCSLHLDLSPKRRAAASSRAPKMLQKERLDEEDEEQNEDEDAETLSPQAQVEADDLNYIQSPISPSFAVSKYRSERRHKHRSKPGGADQSSSAMAPLCYGMDQSLHATLSPMAQSYFEDQLTDDEPTLTGAGANGRNRQGSRKDPAGSGVLPDDGSSGVSSCAVSEHQQATHRVQTAFIPRHTGELLLEIGDPVHVERDSDDHWSVGTNLRNGQHGIFPSVMVFEIDVVDDLFSMQQLSSPFKEDNRDTFCLTLLGSIEVAHHKGNDVLCQAINKVLSLYQSKEELVVPKSVLVDISFKGIHVVDKGRRNLFRCPKFDFFYSLQNISFCGAHPKQLRYFAFITKHPLLPRFAAHVFLSSVSTQPVVESIGRAFKRCYDEYMAFAHPTEDIFLE